MLRLFSLIVFISILLNQFGCKEKTIPAIQEPPKQETEIQLPSPIPVPSDTAVPSAPFPSDTPAPPVKTPEQQTQNADALNSDALPVTDTAHPDTTETEPVISAPTSDAPINSIRDTFSQYLVAETEYSAPTSPESTDLMERIEQKTEPDSQMLPELPDSNEKIESRQPEENELPVASAEEDAVKAEPVYSEEPKSAPPVPSDPFASSAVPSDSTPTFTSPSTNPLRQSETPALATDVTPLGSSQLTSQPKIPAVDVAPFDAPKSDVSETLPQPEVPTPEVPTPEIPIADTVQSVPFTSPTPTVSLDLTENEKKPFDPVAINGELFVGWEKPKLLLVFTGFLNGYVEPCGCAGLEQMKGGLSRRHTFFKEIGEKKGWQVLPIDAGNLNKGFGRQEELKFNIVIDEALRLMKYQAAGIGDRELLLPTDALILYCVDVPGIPRRYTSANVAVMDFDPDFTAPYRIFVQNGVKVGVTSVIAPALLKNVNNDDIKYEDAVLRLKGMLPKFAEEKCDQRILIAYGSTEEINRIVKSVPGQFDYVIPSDTPAEPPFRPNWIDDSMLIEVGEKGKFAVAVGLYDDPETPFRYQRIPFDSRFENSKEITALMQFYQEQLKETGLQGLGIKPIPNRRTPENGKFVGSKSCADCHEDAFFKWKKSKHAAAWKSLTETSKPSRTFDPECIACHVVGWNPAEFLPYEHGFLGEKETPLLLDVGCESCHGPGENHVIAEQGSDSAQQEKHRRLVRLLPEGNTAKKVCIQCHDGDNSPHFQFETYWKKIEHKNKP